MKPAIYVIVDQFMKCWYYSAHDNTGVIGANIRLERLTREHVGEGLIFKICWNQK